MKRWKGTIRGKTIELRVGDVWSGIEADPKARITVIAFEWPDAKHEKGQWPLVLFWSVPPDGRTYRTGAPAFVCGQIVRQEPVAR